MVAVPAATPVTKPAPETDAIALALLLHVPPGLASENKLVVPAHIVTGAEGVMAAGPAITVTLSITEQVPIV
jgi:hypothetical protein